MPNTTVQAAAEGMPPSEVLAYNRIRELAHEISGLLDRVSRTDFVTILAASRPGSSHVNIGFDMDAEPLPGSIPELYELFRKQRELAETADLSNRLQNAAEERREVIAGSIRLQKPATVAEYAMKVIAYLDDVEVPIDEMINEAKSLIVDKPKGLTSLLIGAEDKIDSARASIELVSCALDSMSQTEEINALQYGVSQIQKEVSLAKDGIKAARQLR